MLEVFQLFVLIFAVIATVLPATMAVYFWLKGNGGIAHKIAFMLTGEFISSAVAMYFAYASYGNQYANLSPYQAGFLRIIIFAATVTSTIWLAHYLIKKVNFNNV